MRRPGVVTVIAILDLIFGTLALLAAPWSSCGDSASQRRRTSRHGPHRRDVRRVRLMGVAAGVGMLQMRSWGRILQIVMACFGRPGPRLRDHRVDPDPRVPVQAWREGALLRPDGGGADAAGGLRTVASLKAGGGTSPVVIVWSCSSCCWCVAIIGIIAAIAIPSLLRARIAANEAGPSGTCAP
jgi:hypothetical protein